MRELAYGNLDAFRKSVEDYLVAESRYVSEDILAHKELSPDEKEIAGLLVRNASRITGEGDAPSLSYATPANFTKLRPGDEVRICEPGSIDGGRAAIVDENSIDTMSFSPVSDGLVASNYPEKAEIVVREQNNLDTLISVVRDIRDGGRGVGYAETLAGLKDPRMEGRFGVIRDFSGDEIPATFNESQRRAVRMAMLRPSIAYVQGTPGSGKTHLLSVIARGYARRAKDVVVIALTHQAVNNALNKVASLDSGIPVVKVGRLFKNIGLDERVEQAETFSAYMDGRKGTGEFFGSVGHVVGMTFQAALHNLGLRKSPFIPQIVLFDEAGQVPLSHAVAVGAFGCGSVVFIGDDAQMPPIYHERLKTDPLSMSAFERIKSLYPECGIVLDVTYRMNSEISSFVGDRFYRPRGIELKCDPSAASRSLDGPAIEFVTCDSPGACDENAVEARAAVDAVIRYLDSGLPSDRIAIITPFRRQVRMVYKMLAEACPTLERRPIVDTVERLQGQDVDVIILTFATDDEVYYTAQKSFLLNPNRLNVMFSRATSKVVVISSKLVHSGIEESRVS